MAAGPCGAWHDRVRAIAVMLESAGYTIRFTRDVRHMFGAPPSGTRRRRVHVELETDTQGLDDAIEKVRKALQEDR
jgi:hypothetical protein